MILNSYDEKASSSTDNLLSNFILNFHELFLHLFSFSKKKELLLKKSQVTEISQIEAFQLLSSKIFLVRIIWLQ